MDDFAGNLSSGDFLGSGALSEVLGSIGFQGRLSTAFHANGRLATTGAKSSSNRKLAVKIGI